MCPGREITVTATVPPDYLAKYELSWWKNDLEIIALRGLAQVKLTDPGNYLFRIRNICSGLTMKSSNIWLREVDDPEITFKNTGDIKSIRVINRQ